MLASLLVLVAVVIASVLVIVALHNRNIFLMFGLRLSVGSTCHRCNTSIGDGFSKSTGCGFHLLIETSRQKKKNTHTHIFSTSPTTPDCKTHLGTGVNRWMRKDS